MVMGAPRFALNVLKTRDLLRIAPSRSYTRNTGHELARPSQSSDQKARTRVTKADLIDLLMGSLQEKWKGSGGKKRIA